MFSIIVIISKNNCIGKDGNLLWHIPEDLKRFKKITLNHNLLVGRKCFESLPKVLENRTSIVVTRDEKFTHSHKDVKVCNDLDKFIEENKDTSEEIFVIGGGEIYEKLLPFSKKLYMTFVDKEEDGDTFFPNVDYSMYKKTYESEKYYNEKEGVSYFYANFEKN